VDLYFNVHIRLQRGNFSFTEVSFPNYSGLDWVRTPSSPIRICTYSSSGIPTNYTVPERSRMARTLWTYHTELLLLVYLMALIWPVLWIWGLDTGLLARVSGFHPRPVHMGFGVDKVALGQVFFPPRNSSVSTMPPVLPTDIAFIYYRRYTIVAIDSIGIFSFFVLWKRQF
jgi:hypothetical protein